MSIKPDEVALNLIVVRIIENEPILVVAGYDVACPSDRATDSRAMRLPADENTI